MLTASEQRELCQIEEDLLHSDRGFAWRLTLLQGLLRWAAPGRRRDLPVLAVLGTVLLRLAAAAARLLIAFVNGAMLIEPAALLALGDAAWPGWESGPETGRGGGPAPGQPQSSDGPDPP